jgi:hypothetical protein
MPDMESSLLRGTESCENDTSVAKSITSTSNGQNSTSDSFVRCLNDATIASRCHVNTRKDAQPSAATPSRDDAPPPAPRQTEQSLYGPVRE